ncbi:MAG TPA: right-handed parallel beta-helix repeat-containing protein, partial [Lysobacter sp.]
MPSIRMLHLLIPTAALLVLAVLPARAETYHTCAGFIDSLPATISTQGVWCLRHDLSTAVTTGAAITINTNNVTIDCNDFKLGGLAAGAGTGAVGIYTSNRLNATVRNCNVRGFLYGLLFAASAPASGGGHVIEDNRFESNTSVGLQVEGDGSVVRRNLVTDTGGSTASSGFAYGIYTAFSADVIDNTINGVLPTANVGGDGNGVGIFTGFNANGSIIGNRVRGIVGLGTSEADGIYNTNSVRVLMERNHLVGDGSAGSIGLRCFL